MSEALAKALGELSDAQPFVVGWSVVDLATGERTNRNADRIFPSASTRKVSILMAVLAAVRSGTLSMDETIVLEERLQDDVKSGTLQHMTPGTSFPLRDAVVNMIITSDNVSTRALLERLTLEGTNAYCRRIGMTHTVHRFFVPPSNLPWDHPADDVTVTTPAEQADLLVMIHEGTTDAAAAEALGVRPDDCAWALEVMSWQKMTSMIPALMPPDTKVANKTGRGKRGKMDVGIVYDGARPAFVITYFSDEVPTVMQGGTAGSAFADRHGAELAKAAYDEIVGTAL